MLLDSDISYIGRLKSKECMKEAVVAILSLQLQVYLYQPHTAAEPTEEIPYVDEASGVRGSSRPETTVQTGRSHPVPETSND